jgi:glycogen debranching enzyme
MKHLAHLLIIAACVLNPASARQGWIPAFELQHNDLEIRRIARPTTPFDKVGRKFAILGYESGSFEAWAYPLKLFRNFEFSFLLRNSTRPIRAADVVRFITVSPEATTITFTHQSFTVRATYVTVIDQPGAIILLRVHAVEPLTIVCGFLPVLQPMWPAGLGGQYSYWDDKLKAYIISESSRNNHGLIGSPAASGISYTPAHMLADVPQEFKIEIDDPPAAADTYIPIYMAGGRGKFENVRKTYENLHNDPQKLYREAFDHYKRLREELLHVVTPNTELNLAFEWAKVAYDNLFVDNPDLGKGLIAGLGASGTSGRPGFGWFFGGDAFINSFSLNSVCNYSTVRDALVFTQKTQREDGKMAHELTQAAGYVDWFGTYHFGYIHGDTTPFYIAAMHDYCRMSGDRTLVKQSWASLKRAYDWCLSTDANNDGLMDNRKAGLGALEFGALTGIETDVYLAAVWVRAAYAMHMLANVAGDKAMAAKAKADFEKAKATFDKKFWYEAGGYYTYAFNAQGEQVTELVPWPAVALSWEVGDSLHSVRTLERINSSELTTDWGIRSISRKSTYYEPLNYNYGAVWPFIGSWVATAQFKHHFALQGHHTLMTAVRHSFDNQVGTVSEVFSGATNTWLQEAVSHQGFSSAGVVLPTVRGLVGLEGDAIARVVTFAPQLPADWPALSVKNYRIGEAVFAFEYRRQGNTITLEVESQRSDGFTLRFAPALGAGSAIRSVKINGVPSSFDVRTYKQATQPVTVVPLRSASVTIEVESSPTVELLPPDPNTQTGDSDKGLKILSFLNRGKQMAIAVEGLAGKEYTLRVLNSELVRDVQGGVLAGDVVTLTIPSGKSGESLRHELQINLK